MDKTNKLFDQFPPITDEQWEEIIHKDLKGADYEKKLIWKTNEGINVRPYYRKEDIQKVSHLSEDGTFAYAKTDGSNWKIRQDFVIKDPIKSNKLIKQAVETGAEAIGLDVTAFKKFDKTLLKDIIIGICPEQTELNFICNENAISVLETLKEFFIEFNLIAERIYINIEFDPFSTLITKGKSPSERINILAELIEKSKFAPNMKVALINGSLFGNCGSSMTEELAFAMAEAVEIIDKLTDKGISVEDITKSFKFKFSVGSNYFFEIAKIRAARYIWGKIFESYNTKDETAGKMYIHAETSSWNKTLYDPYVNLLRTTTESMSSAIGGIDSLTILPFNFITTSDDEFSLRMSRNQQVLLKEESNFDKVTDPAAGSYYIETITSSFINIVWDLFLQINDNNGFIKSFEKNFIQDIINTTCENRNNNIATRKENFVGVNQFPNTTERIEYKADYIPEDTKDPSTSASKFKCLRPYRGPEAFEKLRLETELYTERTGNRPKVFLFTHGNLGMRIARAGFTTNFFGCAGYDIINNNGFKTVEEGIKAVKESKAEITVICSSDEEYETIAPQVYDGLKDESLIVVAGNPKECIDMLKEKGIKHFIHVKTNLLEELTKIQKLIIK